MVAFRTAIAKILSEKFVRIFEVDHESFLRGGILGPGLHPALDVWHLPNSGHKVGELRVGGENLKMLKFLAISISQLI